MSNTESNPSAKRAYPWWYVRTHLLVVLAALSVFAASLWLDTPVRALLVAWVQGQPPETLSFFAGLSMQ